MDGRDAAIAGRGDSGLGASAFPPRGRRPDGTGRAPGVGVGARGPSGAPSSGRRPWPGPRRRRRPPATTLPGGYETRSSSVTSARCSAIFSRFGWSTPAHRPARAAPIAVLRAWAETPGTAKGKLGRGRRSGKVGVGKRLEGGQARDAVVETGIGGPDLDAHRGRANCGHSPMEATKPCFSTSRSGIGRGPRTAAQWPMRTGCSMRWALRSSPSGSSQGASGLEFRDSRQRRHTRSTPMGNTVRFPSASK